MIDDELPARYLDPRFAKTVARLREVAGPEYCDEASHPRECGSPCDLSRPLNGARLPLPCLDGDSDRSSALRMLPQPMYLYEFLTWSSHYHFGSFLQPDEPLTEALNRLVLRCTPHFVRGGIVLDVGCGMGGAAALLAENGFPTIGVDVCRRAVDFARLNHAARDSLAFEVLRFQDLAASPAAEELWFDNIVLLEVSHYFPDLGELLEGCARLLAPGGALVLSDVVAVPALDRERVPFHRRGALARAAGDAGFETRDAGEATDTVLPTLKRLIEHLRQSETAALDYFGTGPRRVRDDIRQLISHWLQLQEGFTNGDLVYETVALRAPVGLPRP